MLNEIIHEIFNVFKPNYVKRKLPLAFQILPMDVIDHITRIYVS